MRQKLVDLLLNMNKMVIFAVTMVMENVYFTILSKFQITILL